MCRFQRGDNVPSITYIAPQMLIIQARLLVVRCRFTRDATTA